MKSLNTNEDRKKKQIEIYQQYKRKWNLVLTKSVNECEDIHKLIPNSIILNGTLGNKELAEQMDLVNKAIDGNTGFTIV
jgi:hypothetical protein